MFVNHFGAKYHIFSSDSIVQAGPCTYTLINSSPNGQCSFDISITNQKVAFGNIHKITSIDEIKISVGDYRLKVQKDGAVEVSKQLLCYGDS